jgi:hypothetical protein
MTRSNAPESIPGATAGMTSADTGASSGNPFASHQLIVPGPGRQEARDLSRIPSPRELRRGVAVAIGRDADGNQVTCEGRPGNEPFGMPGAKPARGRISFRSASGQPSLPVAPPKTAWSWTATAM